MVKLFLSETSVCYPIGKNLTTMKKVRNLKGKAGISTFKFFFKIIRIDASRPILCVLLDGRPKWPKA